MVRGVAIAAIVATAITFYAFWAAARLDRLHARVDAARSALDEQLRRRADATARYAADQKRRGPAVRALAEAARDAALSDGLGHEREVVENAVSRALEDIAQLPDNVAEEATRAAIARRFHNDTVRDVLVVRDRRIVRWLHLAGRAPYPAYFEMDDAAGRRTIDE